MRDTITRSAVHEIIPEDLAVFARRMTAAGVRVRLPSAGASYVFPEPWRIKGEPLSETVIRVRRSGESYHFLVGTDDEQRHAARAEGFAVYHPAGSEYREGAS